MVLTEGVISLQKYSVCGAGGVVLLCLIDRSGKCSTFSVIGPESDTLVAGFQPCSDLNQDSGQSSLLSSRGVVFTEPGRPWAGGRVVLALDRSVLRHELLR